MPQSWTLCARVSAALCLVAVTVGSPAASARADSYTVQSVTPWKQNAAPVGWSASLDRVIYNARGADGLFDAYSATPSGSDPRCLTCAIPSFPKLGAATQRGASDVSPDGNYMLLEVERGDHSGPIGVNFAAPGRGAYNDVWLARADGSAAWPLTNIDAPGQQAIGTMWARFDRTGTKLVWAAMYAPAIFNVAYWRLKVADIVWTAGVPHLANVKTIEPEADHFYEPYGFTPDDSHIIFASDLGMAGWWDSQIYTIGVGGSGLTRLSPADAAPGLFTNYNEFAFYTPHNDAIIYGRTTNSATAGMDYWIMRPGGTGSQRLTFFNEPWSTEHRGYVVVGAITFDPNDPDRLLAHVSSDLNGDDMDAVMITLNPPGSGGLEAEYFASAKLTDRALSMVQNPSVGLKWEGAPAPGVPPTNFSVSWTGSVTGPVSGRYTYCVVADDGARLSVGGQSLVNDWHGGERRQCGTVSQLAEQPTSIRLDYWNGAGIGYVQLSWTPPGGSSGVGGQLIPSADLSPAAPTAPAGPSSRVPPH